MSGRHMIAVDMISTWNEFLGVLAHILRAVAVLVRSCTAKITFLDLSKSTGTRSNAESVRILLELCHHDLHVWPRDSTPHRTTVF
jgi:hypothetical protein